MLTVKALKKDLAMVAIELGLKVELEHQVVDLKDLIEGSSQYEKDFEFIKEILNTNSNWMYTMREAWCRSSQSWERTFQNRTRHSIRIRLNKLVSDRLLGALAGFGWFMTCRELLL